MPIGKMRTRVAFQREVNTSDGAGGNTVTWETVYTVWGEFNPVSQRESLQAGRLEALTSGTLTVRSSTDTRVVTEQWRAYFDSTPFQIRSIINPDRRNRFLLMTLEKGPAQ